MNNLRDLKEILILNKIKVKESGGWYLKVGKDTITMAHDVYYINNTPISKKELLVKYKIKKK